MGVYVVIYSGIPHFIVIHRYCAFYTLEVYGNTVLLIMVIIFFSSKVFLN